MQRNRKRSGIRRIVRYVAALAIVGALGFFAMLVPISIERNSELTLPLPSGPYAVSREISVWVDNAHPDPVGPPGAKRELVIWIWYPAEAERPANGTGSYLPMWLQADAAAVEPPAPIRWFTRDLMNVRTHSTPDAPVSRRRPSYPILMLRGGASAPVMNYTTLAEDLASHGYVVVGFDAPYRTSVVVPPDGRVLRRTTENNPELCEGRSDEEPCANRLLAAWTEDMKFVLDWFVQRNIADSASKFYSRLDTEHVGVFGHSFGGAAAALFCQQDARCQAGIDIDGAPHGPVIQAGIQRPFMFLLSDHGNTSDPESARIMGNIQSIYDRLPPQARHRVAIRGANHFLFSDDGALLKSQIVMRPLRALGILGIEGRRQLAVTAYCLHTFFDAYLKGAAGSLPNIANPAYPEIQPLD